MRIKRRAEGLLNAAAHFDERWQAAKPLGNDRRLLIFADDVAQRARQLANEAARTADGLRAAKKYLPTTGTR